MKPVQHMVLLKFKPNTPSTVAEKLFVALKDLKQRLPGIAHFGGGTYASSEGLGQGFTHAFLMTFVDAKARDNYLVHPDHEKVKTDFLPAIENIIVFDFEE